MPLLPDAHAAADSDSTAASSVVVVFGLEAEHVGDSADTEGMEAAADEGEGAEVAPADVGETDTTTAEAGVADKPVKTSVEENEAGGTVRTGSGS